MMTSKSRFIMLCTLVFLTAAAAFASTVMVSYDLVVDTPEELAGSLYISQTSMDVETGIMDELFDGGHIVFNAPGLVILDPSQMPEGLDQESNLANRRLEAAQGGAQTLIYLRLFFSGENEEQLQLASLECEIYRLPSGPERLAREVVIYEDPAALRVNGQEASRILINRLTGVDLF